jgi:hypothetical protein
MSDIAKSPLSPVANFRFGHTAAVPLQLLKLMISSDQIGCDSVLNTAQFRKFICSYKKQSDLNLFLFLRR